MEVEATATAPTAEYGGQTYYFCSDECRQQFEESPQQYATQEAA
jgi:YHS domain-containing protein